MSEPNDEPLDAAPQTAHEAAGAANEAEADSTPVRDVAATIEALRGSGRDPVTGRWLPGAFPRLANGRRSPRLWAQSELAGLLAEREASLVSDYGGPESLSTAERSLVLELARLELLTEAAGDQLVQSGLHTSKGRVRAAASLWLQLLDRQSRLAGQLGLQRRARPAASLATWAATTTGEAKS